MSQVKEERTNRCLCGSTLFYTEMIEDKWYVCCANIKCNNKWIAKRGEDGKIPKFSELRKDWE